VEARLRGSDSRGGSFSSKYPAMKYSILRMFVPDGVLPWDHRETDCFVTLSMFARAEADPPARISAFAKIFWSSGLMKSSESVILGIDSAFDFLNHFD
jgi:hypothetical protein